MMPFDWLGFAVMLAVIAMVGAIVSMSRLSNTLKTLVYIALGLRIAGAAARHYMVTVLYDSGGDAMGYAGRGRLYAERLWAGDFAGFIDAGNWVGNKWWGTQFVRHVAGLATAVLGDSFLGLFLLFSCLSFLGLVGFGMAFRRAYPELQVSSYLRWIWLFPSLWFWPSSIGKEALILLGIGLAMWGFVGRRDRVNWPLLALGLFLVFAVRVQVAAVLVMALVLAQAFAFTGRVTLGKAVQTVIILVAGAGVLFISMQKLGIDSVGLDGVQGYLQDNTGRGREGQEGSGSAIESAPVSLRGVFTAPVNIMLRPFPWETRSVPQLLSALEIALLWVVIWLRRRNVLFALHYWRSDRLLRVALLFIIIYSISLGMLMANLGLIARQRIFLFPFVFILVEAVPRMAQRMARPRSAPEAGLAPAPAAMARSAGGAL
jgi:hypothetical protein